MGSVIRKMRKRSLGEVQVLRREEYEGLELNGKAELIRSLIPLGLMHVGAQPGNGGAGRAAGGDPRAAGAQRPGGRGVAEAGVVRDLVSQPRVGGTRDPGRDRLVELVGVALVRAGERGEVEGVPGA